MQKKVFERTGLIPRSIIRTFDRFLQQLLPGTENLAIQEYRVSRYQILVSIKSLVTIICIPLFVNYTVKSFILTPLTEHFWNSREGQIFINAYQEKRAFVEMQDFSEKIFFESLLQDSPSLLVNQSMLDIRPEWSSYFSQQFSDIPKSTLFFSSSSNFSNPLVELETLQLPGKIEDSRESTMVFFRNATLTSSDSPKELDLYLGNCQTNWWYETRVNKGDDHQKPKKMNHLFSDTSHVFNKENEVSIDWPLENQTNICLNQFESKNEKSELFDSKNISFIRGESFGPIDFNNDQNEPNLTEFLSNTLQDQSIEKSLLLQKGVFQQKKEFYPNFQSKTPPVLLRSESQRCFAPIGRPFRGGPGRGASTLNTQVCRTYWTTTPYEGTGRDQGGVRKCGVVPIKVEGFDLGDENLTQRIPESQLSELTISSSTLNLQKLFQLKSLDIANRYNKQSILAITNLLGDFITFFTIYVLFMVMKPQIIILKSFLTESIYSLSDTTKSFLLILGMDLLVGFHSPRGWEIVLEVLLRHLGLPENENFILLFVALFPVFLDTVFKYWIFRYLNKISPSTVVTYHSMLE